jgi:hypothetical protein
MTDLTTWLPQLDPPPGGYARLAQALENRRVHAQRFGHWRLALASVSLMLIVVLLLPLAGRTRQARLEASSVASGLEQAWKLSAEQDLTVSNGAAIAVLRQPGVRMYWVGVEQADDVP